MSIEKNVADLNKSTEADRVLVVDLDGTLIHTDLLVESISQFLIQYPLKFFKLLLWLWHGKAVLKAELTKFVQLDIPTLPYNRELLNWLRDEKQKGRRLVLATATHRVLADQVAHHLQIFDEVLATEGTTNLKSTAKTNILVALYGQYGYDYVGNDWPDLEVWAKASKAHVVGATSTLLTRARAQGNVDQVWLNSNHFSFIWLFKALRLHQWMKNLLVFVPMLLAHKYADMSSNLFALMAFMVFSLAASSVYLLNDLVDLKDDRHHARKRNRPFASGKLSLVTGWALWPSLLLLAAVLSVSLMPPMFSVILAIYFSLTVAYSLKLKQLTMVDVLTLAALYALRIIAGAVAIDVPLSFWLLLFCMFIFLSLALIKRYSELKAALNVGKLGVLRGRGYETGDLELVASFGCCSGYIAVLVLALYIQDGQTANMYSMPQILWLICPAMLFWISRTWLIAHRGLMHDDPIVFALKDKISWAVCLFMVAVLVLARVLS